MVWLCVQTALAQTPVGRIEVTSFSRTAYGAGTQNWAIAFDHYGRIYIANNEGLLIHNGTNWQLIPIPNKTILRSIAFAADGKLYAGAQDELGFFAPNKKGQLSYTSLKTLLPPGEQTFADIWDIETAGRDVFFRANDKIMRLSGGALTVYKTTSSWLALSNFKGELVAQDEQKGLLVFRGGDWQPLMASSSLPAGCIITDIVPYNQDTCLAASTRNGLFLLVKDKLLPFSLKNSPPERHFTSLVALDDQIFLAGTYSNGIVQFNRSGQVLENINDKNGLINNTVQCIRSDAAGNLWAGLDNGIAYMKSDASIRLINPPSFRNGSGYAARVLNGELYFALSTGLQSLPLSSGSSLAQATGEPITLLEGLTWNLSVINNQLLTGRDDGCWTISGHQVNRVSASPGYWTYQPLSGKDSLKIAAGNYNGIRLFEAKNGFLTDQGGIPDFKESSRYLETEGNMIWVSHPYRGVFKIDLSNNRISRYTQKDGLPADLDNHVFKLKGRIVFATPKGVYEYRAADNKMVPAAAYTKLFGQMPLRYLKEDEKGNIWFVQNKMVGVVDFGNTQPAIQFIPELKNKILSGFENIYPYNTQNVLIGSESGFYLLNYELYRQKRLPLRTYINLIKITGGIDSVLFGGFGDNNQAGGLDQPIPYQWNSLHFSFATSIYGQYPGAEYSFWLEGFDKTWGNWTTQYEKDYTNLPEGKYVFHVKSRNTPSSESGEYTWTFSVSPPWYRTLWAYFMYAVALTALLYTLYKYQEKKHYRKQAERRLADQQKFEEEQRQLTYQHQLELEKTEKELIRLKNENLEAEIEYKNAELASTAMNLVQKKEFLLKLTEELNKLNKPGKETVDTSELKKIIRSLASEEKLDEEWKQFSIHFNNVHTNFLITLKNAHPNLNAHELKLCAYLRMNLTSKEIAQLLSISVRGVEISRYRLRKKLQLQPKEDLFQFLLNLEAMHKKNDQPQKP